MIVRGGMGTVTTAFADAARAAGARIVTDARVTAVTSAGGVIDGVALEGDRHLAAATVVGACDPFRLADLVGEGLLPEPLVTRLRAMKREGTTMKVNLALRGLPHFTCLPAGAPSPLGATMHLLPDGPGVLDAIRAMWVDVQAGRLPSFPTIEWYVHTTVDPSLRDAAANHSSALFVQSVPYNIVGSSWATETDRYVERLLSICDQFAPGTSGLVVDVFALPPPEIEKHFGITAGHIHHVDNTFAFADRMPYATGVDGLYAASAGCHPAGSVIGAAGHNAAVRVLRDLGR
jgi:phytoene dehydrogenase-like protein